jgi:hypothetical protein
MIEFQSYDGTIWPLEGPGIYATQGSLQGLFEPSFEYTIDQRVGADGAVVASSRLGVRRVVLSVYFDDYELVTQLAENPQTLWGRMVASFRAGGVFRFTRADGSSRVLRRIILEAPTTSSFLRLDTGEVHVQNLPLVALDPWWYGSAQSIPLVIAGDSIPWSPALPWSPSLPWNGGATVTINVFGSAPAFPVIDVYGPSTDIVVGVVGGTSWRSLRVLAAGERLTVDHRPGSRGPTLQGSPFPNWSLLTEASRTWTLPVGSQIISVIIQGDTSVTSATLTWEPRWLTP